VAEVVTWKAEAERWKKLAQDRGKKLWQIKETARHRQMGTHLIFMPKRLVAISALLSIPTVRRTRGSGSYLRNSPRSSRAPHRIRRLALTHDVLQP
jgi:hypothetical protein